jgi:hypothetical protein
MRKKSRVKRHAITQPQDQSYRFIPLTQGQKAIVDTSDFEFLNTWNWSANYDPKMRSFYARAWDIQSHKIINMHRLLLGCTNNKERGDHINHDTLDNRRHNLRKCTHAANCKNQRKSINSPWKYKGAYWRRDMQKWHAKFSINGKAIHLGYYLTEIEAAKMYDAAAKKYYGAFAALNFPQSSDLSDLQ